MDLYMTPLLVDESKKTVSWLEPIDMANRSFLEKIFGGGRKDKPVTYRYIGQYSLDSESGKNLPLSDVKPTIQGMEKAGIPEKDIVIFRLYEAPFGFVLGVKLLKGGFVKYAAC